MEYVQVKELSNSEKCRVVLMEAEDGQLVVRKEMAGIHPVYDQLQYLTHPYLPRLLEVKVQAHSTIIYEEYIHAANLSELRLPQRQVAQAMRELCDALTFLHQHGIVHRDIKPSHLLFAPDGHIRLIDFDAARTVKADSKQDTQTLGTKGYAPPEQYGFGQTDARADLYAVGVTFRELLGEAASKRKYARIIKKCMAFDPMQRYSSAGAVKRALSFPTVKMILRDIGTGLAILFAVLPLMQWIAAQAPRLARPNVMPKKA